MENENRSPKSENGKRGKVKGKRSGKIGEKDMKRRLLFWLPRILTILFAVFISLFAMDVWSESGSFGQKLAGFLIHLIPTFAILIILVLAWRWEWVGGAAFLLFGIFYMVVTGMRQHWVAYVSISGPLFLTGILFWVSWFQRRAIHEKK